MRSLGLHFRKSVHRDTRKNLFSTASDNGWALPSHLEISFPTAARAASLPPLLPSRTIQHHKSNDDDDDEDRRMSKKQKILDNENEPNSIPDITPTAASNIQDDTILLLEGDQYHFSKYGGIARSFYQLVDDNNQGRITTGEMTHSSIAIEEHYDIVTCRKAYVIREGTIIDAGKESSVKLGEPVANTPLILQEIPESITYSSGTENSKTTGPGTGSRTWESALAMSMFFGQHPELLVGRCIEVGSGVGLGGILSYLLTPTTPSSTIFQSLTLTDYKDQVINQCRENIVRICGGEGSTSLHSTKLNWHDFVQEDDHAMTGLYDTVLACDCAYLHADIFALATTLKKLMRKSTNSRCYIFGPSNREGLHELIHQLRQDPSYQVTVEDMNIIRYRLDDSFVGNIIGEENANGVDFLDTSTSLGRRQRESNFFSRTRSTFSMATLLLRCHPFDELVQSMSDID